MSNLTAQQIYEQTKGSRKKVIGTFLGNDKKLLTCNHCGKLKLSLPCIECYQGSGVLGNEI